MKLQSTHSLLVLGWFLGAASAAFGQGPTFTTIDVPGATSTTPWALNNRDNIVGLFVNPDKSTHGFLLSAGQYTTIDYPGASGTELYGINPSGDFVGVYTLDGVRRGFLLKGGQFSSIDFPGAATTETSAITPKGDIVGFYVGTDKVTHGYVLSGGQYTTADFPGTTFTLPSGVNAQGDISGSYGSGHAYLLSDGEFTPFDVPGATFTTTTGLNARGDIVGRYVSGGVSHGYLFISGQFSTIDFPGATYTGATSINQRRDILGRYRKADGVTHGFLLLGFQPACIAYLPRVAALVHSSDYTPVTASKPAAAGEVLSLFASGLGPTRPSVDPGQPFPASPLAVVSSPVEVRVNGAISEMLGAVGFPGAVDGYQVNFRLPADAVKGPASVQLASGLLAGAPVQVPVQ